MNGKSCIVIGALLANLLLANRAAPQGGMYWERGADGRPEIVDRGGVPTWEIDPQFKSDVFTFARVEYSSRFRSRSRWDFLESTSIRTDNRFFAQRGRNRSRGGRWRGGNDGWDTDFPEADLNFSYRLQQLTSFKVNPVPVVVRLTDEDLFDYPFIYMVEVHRGALEFTPEEIVALRRYLLNGGFLMVDDFWSEEAWQWFYAEIRRVFPDREYVELPIEHEIFRSVYKLKEKPQVPAWNRGIRDDGITYEWHGLGSETVHYRAILDDKGRIMVLACHNTDIGDGWEREGYDEWYFHNFCENKAYPMGINIVTYALTH
jgi:hypothetical protein